jgi:hypothetical protein
VTVTLPPVKNSSDEEDGEELDENLAHKKDRNGKKRYQSHKRRTLVQYTLLNKLPLLLVNIHLLPRLM